MPKAKVLRYRWNFLTNRRELIDNNGKFVQPEQNEQTEQHKHKTPDPYDDDYIKCVRDNICPVCKSYGLEHSGGCVVCRHCGWSACG